MRVAVVGRGLMGSAAARHLAKAGHEVVLVGPDEPAEKRTHRGVFASHYDEGRITRKNATDPYWAEVSIASIARYAEIEAESGVSFFDERGAMIAGAEGGPLMQAARATQRALSIECEALDRAALRARFPFFAFPEDWAALYEPTGAGCVSPRRLVAAQTEAARRRGAAIVPEPALGIGETKDGVVIRTASGEVRAERALVASGMMTDHVLGRAPKLSLNARTVALFEVTEAEARRLAAMPSLVFRWSRKGDPYLLPPVLYPDGAWRLKLGGDPEDVKLTSPEMIGDWFRSGGNPEVRDFLEEAYRELMPDVRIGRVTMDACVTTWTGDGYPEIRRLSPRIAVATGGNGAGAKCSDELGRRGALALVEELEDAT